MNLLYTTARGYNASLAQENIGEWQSRNHLVEYLPAHRLSSYLRFDLSSSLALIDAIVCSADAEPLASFDSAMTPHFNHAFEHALKLAREVRNLPEYCAMSDGRKWRSIPFIIFYSPIDAYKVSIARDETHANLVSAKHSYPPAMLMSISPIVEDYRRRVLADYRYCGIFVRFENGRAQINPALKKKNPLVESEFYYPGSDRRRANRWVTFSRDSDGLRSDVEMLEILLNKRATETEMHKFFCEHPSILMEARKGIPHSHELSFDEPKNWKPDFAFSSILGPVDGDIELLELKGPSEKTVTRGFHPGFTRKVHAAIDQVRDYDRSLRHPANEAAILKALGRIPMSTRLAVLIGRDPRDSQDKETLRRRRDEIDVKIVTYDEILMTQSSQL